MVSFIGESRITIHVPIAPFNTKMQKVQCDDCTYKKLNFVVCFECYISYFLHVMNVIL